MGAVHVAVQEGRLFEIAALLSSFPVIAMFLGFHAGLSLLALVGRLKWITATILIAATSLVVIASFRTSDRIRDRIYERSVMPLESGEPPIYLIASASA